MRCQFCGWDNPQGKETCEKCNNPLLNSQSEGVTPNSSTLDNHDRPTDRHINGEFNPHATVREVPIGKTVVPCPDCGYPLENGECSACGYKVGNDNPSSTVEVDDLRKTIRPKRKGEKNGEIDGEFKLIPISEETGMSEGDELLFEGSNVVLNRDNTDPNNSTITSHEQAALSFENGKWSIEDKSEYKTTFVQASRKVELQQGDLILLGNQLYRFEL